MVRESPSLRNNNGALQVRVRLEGRDHFINRLGRWDDPIAVAKAQAISAEIWRDFQQGQLESIQASGGGEASRAAQGTGGVDEQEASGQDYPCLSGAQAVWRCFEKRGRGEGVPAVDGGRRIGSIHQEHGAEHHQERSTCQSGTEYGSNQGAAEKRSGKSLGTLISGLNPELGEKYRMDGWQSGTTGRGHNCRMPKAIRAVGVGRTGSGL